MQFLSFSSSSSSLPWRQFSSNWISMKWPTILIFFQFKGFTCFPFFLLVVWCVGLSFKFFELFHYSNVKLLQVLCLMAPLKPPSIFKYKALFGFQLPTFPLNFFPSNFVLLESSHAPLVLLILTLLHYAMLLLHLLMHSLILFILTLLHQAMLL